MRVLVLGASGFVGRNLVEALKRCENVSVQTASRGVSVEGAEGDVRCDVTSSVQVEEVIGAFSPDFVINLAGAVRGATSTLYDVNLTGAMNVVCAVRKRAPSAAIVQFGSAAEYGRAGGANALAETSPPDPVGAYGFSKLAATTAVLRLAREWDIRAVVLRPFNIVGAHCPSTLLVGALVERIRRALDRGDTEIVVGRVDTRRDFVAVEDVVEAVLGILRVPRWPPILNVSSGRAVEVRWIVEKLVEASGAGITWRIDPSLVRADDPETSFGSHDLLRATVGMAPETPIGDALRRAWRGQAAATGN